MAAHLIQRRALTGAEAVNALRPFYFAVHPDFFGQHPRERVGLLDNVDCVGAMSFLGHVYCFLFLTLLHSCFTGSE